MFVRVTSAGSLVYNGIGAKHIVGLTGNQTWLKYNRYTKLYHQIANKDVGESKVLL